MNRPHVLLTRLSAIGDCMETLPLANAIKDEWPEAELTWVVDCGVDALLKEQPAVDRVIRLRKGFLKRPSEVWQLRQQIRKLDIDLSIDPQGLFKSAVLGWLGHASMRIGFAAGQAREKAWWFYHHRIEPTATHLVERQLELLKPLGIQTKAPRFGWKEPVSVVEWVEPALEGIGVRAHDYYVLNPGASWPSKRWSVERYQEVAKALFARWQLRAVVVWGGDEERAMAEAIVDGASSATILAPNTNLPCLAGILKRSLFYLGSDTGPMHIAAAVGTPCVAMFGVSRPEYCGPFGPGHRVVQLRYDGGTSTYRRQTTNAAMLEITSERIIDECSSIIAPHRGVRAQAG